MTRGGGWEVEVGGVSGGEGVGGQSNADLGGPPSCLLSRNF